MDFVVKNLKYCWSKTNRFHRVIFVLAVVESGIFPGFQYGFLCNDPDLSYTYQGDTVSWKWLVATAVVLPLIVMLAIELKYHKVRSRCRSLRWFEEYIYGFLLNITVVETLKLLVGTPRPHFFDTCRPKEAKSCKDKQFVSRYECTNSNWLNQSDRSFPSGHTSVALHLAIFLAYYLHKRVPSPGILTRLTQLFLLASAMLCGGSRIIDHRHHCIDVFAGSALALPFVFYTIFTLCNNFESEESEIRHFAHTSSELSSYSLLEDNETDKSQKTEEAI